MLSVNNYSYKTWAEKFSDGKVNLGPNTINIHPSWKPFLLEESQKQYFKDIEEYLTDALTETKGTIKFFPYPDLIYNALLLTPLNNIKCVIIGQDPYHENEVIKSVEIPQAMGLSFSVPIGIKIPSSLQNIYKNQQKFGHSTQPQPHGNLEQWATQGVLLMNSALTVEQGHANMHADEWKPFTDNLIRYISTKCTNLVFMLWGSPALSKFPLINQQNNHKIIISSHPSGLSCNNKLKTYGAFVNVDHFGEANRYLIEKGKTPINWQLS